MSDELTELPEGWIWVALEEIADHLSGIAFKSSNFTTQGIQVIRLGNVYRGELNLERDPVFLPEEFSLKNFVLKPGNIIVSQTGTRFKRDYGYFVSIPENAPPLLLNQRLLAVRCHPFINPQYVVLASKLKSYQDYFFSQETGGVNQGNVGVAGVMEGTIPLAPLNEQKRIVAKIEELRDRHQTAKQALEAVPKLCDRFRQSVLAAAFRGDLTADWREENPDVEPASVFLEKIRSDRSIPKKAENKGIDNSQLPEIPESWVWVSLEEIATHKSGIAFKSSEFTNDGIQVIRLGNVYKGQLNLSRDPVFLPKDYLVNSFSLSAGNIVVSQTGTRFKRDYGNFVLIPEGYPKLLLNQRLLAVTCHSLISPEYVVFVSKLKNYQDHFFSHETGGVNQGNVGVAGVMKGLIPLAPEKEEKILLVYLKEAFEYINKIESACQENETYLEALNQSILAKAFRGELVEQEPNDEPASVLLDRIRAERQAKEGKKSGVARGKRKKASNDQLDLPGLE